MQKPFARQLTSPTALALGALLSLSACAKDETNTDLPVFEQTGAEIQATYSKVTTEADGKLALLAKLDPAKANLTFDTTFGAFEEIIDPVFQASLRAYLLKDVSPVKDVMDTASTVNDQYTTWFTQLYLNGEVYKVLKAYAKTAPKVDPDQTKLMTDTLFAFEKNGLTEAGTVDPQVKTLLDSMTAIQAEITKEVKAANAVPTTFTAAELEGLSAEQLADLKMQGADYVVLAGDRGTLRDVIMTYATKETTRQKAKLISNSRANTATNIALITDLVKKRTELAKLLKYDTWADYKTVTNMAKNGQTASKFVDDVSAALKVPGGKVDKEVAAMLALSNSQNNNVDPGLNSWDFYFFRRLYEESLKVDYQALSQRFPYETVVNGMFTVYGKIFGLQFEYVKDAKVWHPDVKLVKISDAADKSVIGYIYLDMFPRLTQGKMGHFASDAVVTGKRLANGKYRKPVNALTCNFPVDANGKPKNMLYTDIEMLFHEFGHGLHVVLSKARYASQYGFNVPQDFVEVPSSFSEYFIYDPQVFKALATPSADLTDAYAQTTIDAIKTAQLATKGLYYGRQFGFAKMDFAIHTFTDPTLVPAATDPNNLIALTNAKMAEAYLAYPKDSSNLTSFEHLLTWGYDGGYYAYAWSDRIAAEFAETFAKSAKGFMDPDLGMKYRKEVLEAAASRDVNESARAFLGHDLDPTYQAFLKTLGVQ